MLTFLEKGWYLKVDAITASLKNYCSVTKPGIIFGNLITVAGGFFLASKGVINFPLFLATMVGIALVIASGCVFNNYIDRDIDKVMERTRSRALAQGLISNKKALIFAVALGAAGIFLLYSFTNMLAAVVAAVGLFVYVVMYSLWLKRSSVYGTLVGSISGAVPPVVGYCAVTNRLDAGAIILFCILCLWQMPHSYAIAIFRYNDYAAASIPVLPIKKGISAAKISMFIYIVIFFAMTLMLTVYGYTGYSYLCVAIGVGAIWIKLAWAGFKSVDDKAWARKVFFFSIIIIMVLSIMMSVDFNAVPSPLFFAPIG